MSTARMTQKGKEVSEMILKALKDKHLTYYELVTKVIPKGTTLADITRGFGELWEEGNIDQDTRGAYYLKEGESG
jgi:hypothetical protein